MNVNDFMQGIISKNPGELAFHQAVREFVENVIPFINDNTIYIKHKIMERIVEPERVIMFKVNWVDDAGEIRTNRGYRVQMNSVIGPYKGGLRFHPTVSLDTLKFLAFEQTFKNSLTTLSLGGAKGGSDFDPKGKSDNEIRKFCECFMLELSRYIGPNLDVPAGDIGVGGREIGYLFGHYRKIKNEFTGTITGKGTSWGGSLLRPEATGFGVIYFLEEMLKKINTTVKGKTIAVSGFGNVAWGAVMKATELGAKVVTISGPDGYIYDPDGIKGEKIDFMLELRYSNKDIVKPYADKYKVKFIPNKRPWEVPVDIAIPCAIQNELGKEDAQNIIKNKTICVVEGANMPCTIDAIKLFHEAKILYAPGKAANAGGVSISGIEMAQNSLHLSWTSEEVDERLKQIMKSIHDTCVKYGNEQNGYINYMKGANIGGFVKVANSMIEQGLV
ncbi:MAG: NADP-specific glutamate dehydrogenase [Bacteroidales bacterium]